ncbi:hypothetical protein MNB_SV-3-17 [hydrothermal vent metagenome]|uniref:Haem-binding domain-containing protein n=1 Tax=hydrothermal vent metagenome TaxID=652676 RepID=A0A1W1BM16_9ZZZZ
MFKQVAFWSIGVLLLLQTIQIDIPEVPNKIDTTKEINAPQTIASMLKVSCYDCHSYKTKIPWYGNIAPVSWEVKTHIRDGRNIVNFQEWGNYDEAKKQKIYRGIVKSIMLRMPLPEYISMHKETSLSLSQRRELKNWAKAQLKKKP